MIGRMIQIDDFIAELQETRARFGNTCVYVKDCSWGAVALNRKARDEKMELSCDDVQRVVCRYFKVDRESMRSKSRRKAISYARSVAIYLCRVYTSGTLESIGRIFNRKHSTVLFQYEKIKRALRVDEVMRKEVEFLSKQIKRV